MSIQLQIAIPLFVTVAALAGIAVWRKYFKPEVFVIGLVVLSLGVGMTLNHVNSQSIWDETDADTISNTNAVSLMMARQLLLMDRTDEAMDILEELSQVSGDNEQIRLTMARGAMLQNNYAAAVQLYSQSATAPKKELTHARQLLASTQSGDASFLTFLGNHGANPKDYGMDADKVKIGDREAAKTLILKAIKKELEADEETYGSEWVDAAEAAAQITMGFKAYVEGTGDAGAAQEAMKTLSGCIYDAPGLKQNTHVRLARLRGNIMAGDYEKVAAAADEHVSTQELLVLAELYVKGLVSDDDFSQDYMGLGESGVRKILSLCSDVLDGQEDKLTDREAERYQEKLDKLEQSLETPGRFTMEQGLLDSVSSGDPALRSKSYLALAKLEDHAGNEEQTANYIGQAIGTAGDSSDDSYRAAMNQVSQIVQGTTEADEIKNVAIYVDRALEHSLEGQVQPSMLAQKEQTENPAPEDEKSFADSMTQNINESTATLNIGSINKDEFPEVKARVQIQSTKWDTVEEIKKNLQVYDCGSTITDFKLEQMEFERSRIILLCDISGSMSGNVEQLKQAIVAFAEQMQEGEEVSVIGFDDDIVFIHEFSGDKETVKSYANSIKIAGGTAVYKSLLKAGEVMPYDPTSNNVIIAMTDGQDGNPAKEGDMRNYIGALSADKDVTIYTVGLGSSVDLDYLEMMARYGNGSCLYAKSIDELSDFYDFIHGQLHNQYILTYKAKNLTKNQRLLELSLKDEIGRASKTYYLQEPEYTDEDSSSYNPYTVEDTEVVIYGFTAKSVSKSSQDQTLTLRGEGFDSGDEITVRIIGNEEFKLKAEFKDSKTYTVTLPKEVSVGTYDLSVSLQGESVKLENELTVGSQMGRKTYRYGSYVFTASSISTDGNDTTTLSGDVMMGSWLHFKGDLIIQGKSTDERIRVTDNSGCYISYSASTAQGLAKTVADLGISISLGKLGTIQLYGDYYTPGERENFRTQAIDVLWQLNLKCFKVENLEIAVYPDALEIRVPKMEFELPLQKQVLRDLSVAKSCKLENELDLQLTSTRIALKDTAKYTAEKAKNTDFVMVSLPLRLYKAELVIDTLKQEYSLTAEVRLKALAAGADPTDENYFKLEVGIKDGKFDAIGLQTDAIKDVVLVPQPVPISMGDFGFKVGNFSQYDSDDSILSNLLNTEITFKFIVKVGSLEAYLPGIEELLDKKDIALATLDNCELSLKLKEFRIAFKADVKLCGAMEIGKCRVVMGQFDYTNTLIGYYNETEYGLQVAVTVGSTWKTNNISLQLTGTGELTLGYPYSGLWYDGDVDFDVGWWLLRADFAVSGDILIGAYRNSLDQLQFSVIVKGTNNKGQSSGFHVYFTKSTGLGMHSY